MRQVPCADELIAGGEGRVGDWLLENAVARFVVRGTYASLTRLGEPGGTLIDAARPGESDLLLEYTPDADRSTIRAVQGDDFAELVLPGVTWRLVADSAALEILGADAGTLQGRVDVERTGATLGRSGDAGAPFFGLDGTATALTSAVGVTGVTRAALSADALWPDGEDIEAAVDAEVVRVTRAGGDILRVGVVDGVARSRVPADASRLGERAGCAYEGLDLRGCGVLRLRVADDMGEDLSAVLTDGTQSWRVPQGGGDLPIGPDARRLWVWAGPAWSVAEVAFPGGDAARDITLIQEWDPAGSVLAAPLVPVAPGADATESPARAMARLAGEGVGFAVLVADDEVPSVTTALHDDLFAVAASRAAGIAWSWPWTPNSKRAAHGAVPWAGLAAADLLAVSEGGQSGARLTVVDAAWVAQARGEGRAQDWDPRPDAFWLESLDDVPVYLSLLEEWVDVAPLGPRTWIGLDDGLEVARNVPAAEAGIVRSRTTAGTGPRLQLVQGGRAPVGTWVTVRLDAARWTRMRTVTVWTSSGSSEQTVDGAGTWRWRVPEDATWVVATAEGDVATPWSSDRAWAVSGPLWLRGP